jgi:uncharacterized membrane protein YphA (DoxX/SURF4 family)
MNGTSAPVHRTLSHLGALAVAGVFFFAAYSKITYPGQFVIDIKNYRIVPESMLNSMAILMPWWEVGAAVALLIPRTRRAGAMLITAMLVMFICAVSYSALYKGYNINCGCFGHGSAKAGLKTIGLDVALLIGTWLAYRRSTVSNAGGFPVVPLETAA